MIIISQALGAEVTNLVTSVEIVLPDIESHLIDYQNPKPKLLLSKVAAIAMSPSVEINEKTTAIILNKAHEEPLFRDLIALTKNSVSKQPRYSLVPIATPQKNLILMHYQWKKRWVHIFLEADYFQSVVRGQKLLFQDVWLVSQNNLILSHSNQSWFAQKMSDLDQVGEQFLSSNTSGKWEGHLQGNDLTLFYQAIPKTNLRLIGVHYPESLVKAKSVYVTLGALFLVLGAIGGAIYFKRAAVDSRPRLPRVSLKAHSQAAHTSEGLEEPLVTLTESGGLAVAPKKEELALSFHLQSSQAISPEPAGLDQDLMPALELPSKLLDATRILSDEALNSAIATLEETPEVGPLVELELDRYQAVLFDREVTQQVRRPKALDIETRVRKPKGNPDVT